MLSLSLQRVIFSDNGTLSDLSTNLNNYLAGTSVVAATTAEDYLYVGSELPFNHRWFDVSVVNAVAAVASVSLWTGSAWEAAVDVVDGTANSSGVSLAQSGHLSWTKDKTKSWSADDTENITGLTTLKIYDFYWARIAWSATLTGTTALKHVGFKFASDTDLAAQYVDLNLSKTKTAFVSGKTTWDDQHFTAAEEVVKWLKTHKHLWSPNQIFDYSSFTLAAVHKVAQIIMANFGPDYDEPVKNAVKRFNEMMNVPFHRLDRNGDAEMEAREKAPPSVSWVRR